MSDRGAYYNEFDPYAAQWLRNLIAAGHIAPGDVDERSIVDVSPDDVRGYSQCHWFAGIGGWSLALRLAGWDDDRPCWTGSCPCQPFSSAGKNQGGKDERHLWPHWFRLIRECQPAIVFGEQVEAAIGWGWLDAVLGDLETAGYATGAQDWAHTVSGRRTSDSDCGSWPTPKNLDAQQGYTQAGWLKEAQRRSPTNELTLAVHLASWPTPTDAARASWATSTVDDSSNVTRASGQYQSLTRQAQTLGPTSWATPSSRDWKDSPGMATSGTNPDGSTRQRQDQLPRQAHGTTSSGSPAATERRGQLAPAFSMWLQGYPPEWLLCAPTKKRK